MDSNQYTSSNSGASHSGSGSQRTRIHLGSFLPSVIRNLAEGISTRLAKTYTEQYQLTITEWRILLQLAEHQSLHAAQIVENTSMEKSKISRALSSMEADGMVRREVDDEDNRRQRLALSDYGWEIYRQIAPSVLDWEKQLIEGLEVAEYRDLLFLLEKLNERLKVMDKA